MERNKDTRPLWRRKTEDENGNPIVGKLYLRTPGMDPHRRIRPGERIRATASQLGMAINQFELLEGDVDKEELKVQQESVTGAPTPVEEYSIESVGSGWYEVLSPDGKRMNDKALRADKARQLKEQLEAESGEH